ncbi:MAG: hypothetical protein IH891_05435 [Planctomycetes bacterium]|nr:hypothetical protein [Planctomycetota bacterium]
MSTHEKRFAAIAGAVVVGVLLFLGVIRIGLGEYLAMVIFAGIAVVTLTLIGRLGKEYLPVEIGSRFHHYCLHGNVLAILAIVVMSRMYPSRFTPDFMAPKVSVSQLESKLEKWSGHKRRIQGTIMDIRHADSSPSDDYILLEVWVEDASGKMFTFFRMPRGNMLPATGSEIVAIGQVELDINLQESFFVIDDMKILKAGSMFVIVDDQ